MRIGVGHSPFSFGGRELKIRSFFIANCKLKGLMVAVIIDNKNRE
jgi:hypothetical protein